DPRSGERSYDSPLRHDPFPRRKPQAFCVFSISSGLSGRPLPAHNEGNPPSSRRGTFTGTIMGQRRNLQGSRILITGASQGIGRSLAVLAAKRGAKVLAAARSAELLHELAEEVRKTGGTLETVIADVTSPEDRQKMVEAAMRHFGGLDVLINNAGIGATGHLVEADPERLRKIFEVNVFGLTETT